MRVEVTEDDIHEGVKGCHWSCALALAIGRVEGVVSCNVTGCGVWVEFDDDTELDYDLPGDAQAFVHDFDNGENVEPQVFVLEAFA